MLNFVARWLVANTQMGAVLIAGLIASLALSGLGWAGTTWQLASARKANTELAIQLGGKQATIDQMLADSKARADTAEAALKVAERSAQQSYAQARSILNARPINPSDLCASARQLVDEAIAQERQ